MLRADNRVVATQILFIKELLSCKHAISCLYIFLSVFSVWPCLGKRRSTVVCAESSEESPSLIPESFVED